VPRKPVKEAAGIEKLLLWVTVMVTIVVVGLIFAVYMISYLHSITNRIYT
jgi:cell division protein FtsL